MSINTPYVLVTSRSNLFAQQDRIADHVANVNSLGYKPARNIFSEHLVNTSPSAHDTSFPVTKRLHRDFSQGQMQVTNRALDVAVRGPGFFALETPLGQRYTRAGDFSIDANGVLISKDGYPVTGAGGAAIEFNPTDTDISIRASGQVVANGEVRGQIGVFVFDNPQQLERAGNGLYLSRLEEPQLADPQLSHIAQGMLESSNVNSTKEMSKLIEVSRGIEQINSLMKNYDDNQLAMIRQLSEAN